MKQIYTNIIAFGHKRLSIIDNKTGKQPMLSEDENVVVIYNGEIYNFLDLKKNIILNLEQTQTQKF